MISKRYKFLGMLLAFTGIMIILNIPVSIRVGVNGRYRQLHMPLYVKCTQFLARHYEYARLSGDILSGCSTGEEKAIAILEWTRQNLKDVPLGMPVYDDHIANIIIRGYGTPSQFQDVFTTLCSYGGLPSYWDELHSRNGRSQYAISFVKIEGKWRVFDAYYGLYFRKADGTIASAEEIINDRSLVRGEGIDSIVVDDVPYKDFYDDISSDCFNSNVTLRPYRQMPVSRLVYEIRKLFGHKEL